MLGKLENGQLKRATNIIRIDDKITVNPKEEDYLNAGYKQIIDNRLEDKEGFWQRAEYTETDNEIIINYTYEEMTDEVI